jgi:hypothetical protein
VVWPLPKGQKKKKKKKWVLGFWGWPDHLQGPGVAEPTIGGGRSHPQAFRGGSTTPKGPKKKKSFGFLGVVRPSPKGVVGPPLDRSWGGWSHPQFPSSFFFNIFLFLKIKNNNNFNGQNDVILGEPKTV